MHQDEETARRRHSFGSVAEHYARFRPPPPDAAIEWLLPSGVNDVLELGAGTGALTGLLTRRFSRVRAVEPDDRMRTVLEAAATGAEVVSGVAEQIPADDHAYDTVIAASAWHWVDEERAFPEVARVLRPGGTLALLWSGPDRTVDWMRTLWAGGTTPTTEAQRDLVEHRSERHVVNLPGDGTFTEPQTTVLHWTRPMTKDDFIGLIGTYSAFITMDEDTWHQHRAGLADALDRLPQFTGNASVDVPMRCRCWRSTLA
ncbi:MAG TPA: class I SAM-dependent methyltransferase [Acidimicrobiales bacterium]|jgi:SAM-dependent methyltransferase|nr:class I SAM-dependent methyltransferase [Acidimicrobiales bacterium]